MSVRVRPYQGGEEWEVDVRVVYRDGVEYRERRKSPVSGKAAALRWGQDRERWLINLGQSPLAVRAEQQRKAEQQEKEVEQRQKVPTVREFGPRFMSGYAKANQHKPSGISGKESILRAHLVPRFGHKRLDEVTTEDVQQMKSALASRSPKTVNNVLTVLNTMLRVAVEWKVIEAMPCTIRLLKVAEPPVAFFDFGDYERLVECARREGKTAELIVLLGGEAGLRCGEIMALEWGDVDLARAPRGQITVARSEWKGHMTLPKGGKVRHVPMTARLAEALRAARHLKGARVLYDREGKPLTQKVVQDIVRRVARRAKVKPGVHILRHSFCSHLAMRGAPARAIQELAGHQDLTTTQRYMHLSPSAIEQAIRLLDQPAPPAVPTAVGDILETGSDRAEKVRLS